ncbi:MAG: hypothetical protein ONB41_08320 [candidate division KSB1 bacterium]|nr:hypothetical protein [candidate division KSB1 bacterium]
MAFFQAYPDFNSASPLTRPQMADFFKKPRWRRRRHYHVRDDIERLVQAIYQANPRIDLDLATVIPRRRTSAQQQQWPVPLVCRLEEKRNRRRARGDWRSHHQRRGLFAPAFR